VSTIAPPLEVVPLERQLLGVAGYVANLRRGPRAVLRRLSTDPSAVPPQEFWDVVERYGILQRDENLWLRLIPLMVRHPHAEVRPGASLARAGVSAARIERWLRQDADGALAEAGRLLSHLGDGGLNWPRLGRLLHDWDRPGHGPRLRRDLARDFFLSPEFRARSASTGE
jgi:CRISPR type I-E-associated protein CasB/Cse2